MKRINLHIVVFLVICFALIALYKYFNYSPRYSKNNEGYYEEYYKSKEEAIDAYIKKQYGNYIVLDKSNVTQTIDVFFTLIDNNIITPIIVENINNLYGANSAAPSMQIDYKIGTRVSSTFEVIEKYNIYYIAKRTGVDEVDFEYDIFEKHKNWNVILIF